MGDRSPMVVARVDDEGDGTRGKCSGGPAAAAAAATKEDHLIKSR